MRILSLTSAAAALAAPGESQTSTSTINTIVGMLRDMQKEGASQIETAEKEAAEMKASCAAATTGFQKDIDYTTENLNEATACNEAAAGKSQQKAGQAVELQQHIAAIETAKRAKTVAYTEKLAVDRKNVDELREGHGMLNTALSVLSRALSSSEETGSSVSFLQSMPAADLKSLKKTILGLAAVVDAGRVFRPDNQKKFRSFVAEVSTKLDISDKLSFAQAPQAGQSSYAVSAGSQEILNMIEDMIDEVTQQISDLNTNMLNAKHEQETFAQTCVSTVESKTAQSEEARSVSAEQAGIAGECKSNAEEEGANLAAAEKQLKTKDYQCKNYAEEHEKTQADMAEEQTVLAQAIDILAGAFENEDAAAGFLQVKRVTKHTQTSALDGATDSASMDKKARFAKSLERLGRKYSAYQLIQAATQVQSGKAGVFDKILKMINDMIVKLEDEQANEAAAHADCEANKAEGDAMMKESTLKVNKLTARADTNTAAAAKEVAKKNANTETLEEQRSQMTADTKFRQEESSNNASVVKECTLAIDALTKAISTLREFYNADASGKGVSPAASNIIDMLGTAAMDFEKEKVDVDSTENEAQNAYDNAKQAFEVTSAQLTTSIDAGEKAIATHKKNGVDVANDLAEAEKELEAGKKFVAATNAKCTVKVMSFEEKQAKRKAEIDGLKVALDILNEEAAA